VRFPSQAYPIAFFNLGGRHCCGPRSDIIIRAWCRFGNVRAHNNSGHRSRPEVTRITASLPGVAGIDLYTPILTFVFGEAIGGPCAVVSANRLRQEFYGLPADRNILRERLLKEAVNELGHTAESDSLRRSPLRYDTLALRWNG
jgi:Peptidase family M54